MAKKHEWEQVTAIVLERHLSDDGATLTITSQEIGWRRRTSVLVFDRRELSSSHPALRLDKGDSHTVTVKK